MKRIVLFEKASIGPKPNVNYPVNPCPPHTADVYPKAFPGENLSIFYFFLLSRSPVVNPDAGYVAGPASRFAASVLREHTLCSYID